MNREERQMRLRGFLKMIAPDQNLEALSPRRGFEMVTSVERGSGEEVDRAADDLEKLEQNVPLSEESLFGLEAIVLAEKRPVVFIQNGDYRTPPDPWVHFGSGEVKQRITSAISSIGRIELPDNLTIPFGGTGFVVGDNLIMTNRHVAMLFAAGLGKRGLRFQPGQSAGIDFLREHGSGGGQFIVVDKIVMIHPYWDMALLKVSGLSSTQRPLTISVRDPDDAAEEEVAVVGYPARDWRNDLELQDRIFEKIYNVKRLQPGMLRTRSRVRSFDNQVNALSHDSSTLGGNSGSAVIDVSNGQVIALHFAGEYLKANYAVPAYELARDAHVVDAGVKFGGSVPSTMEWHFAWERANEEEVAARPSQQVANQRPIPTAPPQPSGETTITIPLEITFRLGEKVGTVRGAGLAPAVVSEAEEAIKPDADYSNRDGYDPNFLGSDMTVALPGLTKSQAKIAVQNRRSDDGDYVLPYHHFSVVMNGKRRFAFFTAVNIDGRREKSVGRGGVERWFRDPRILAREQFEDDLYAANRFDRGHLVRRLDPVWGTAAEAKRANDDTFHWTNCSPQHEQFNRNKTTWGLVENWILVNVHAKNQRVSVFTGPVFRKDDPIFVTRDGMRVPVPLEYWKVIAMLNHEGELTATAYLLSQDDLIADMVEAPKEPKSFQVPVRTIELLTKLNFHQLAEHDPFVSRQEASGLEKLELDSLEEIVLS